jgi:hypothetical protein
VRPFLQVNVSGLFSLRGTSWTSILSDLVLVSFAPATVEGCFCFLSGAGGGFRRFSGFLWARLGRFCGLRVLDAPIGATGSVSISCFCAEWGG